MKTPRVDVIFGREIEVEVEVEAVVNPGYPAPHCQDHDSPAFSDPGDPGDIEEMTVYLQYTSHRTGKIHRLDVTNFLDQSNLDELEEQAFEELT